MPFQPLVPNLYALNLNNVNLFLLEEPTGLTLIDTGYAGSEDKILAAVRELGKEPGQIRQILLTHNHPDHAGSLAALQAVTGATTYAHALDAAEIRTGRVAHPAIPSPFPVQRLLYQLLIRNSSPAYPAAKVDHELQDGDLLPVAGGLQVIHTPGHSPGHVAYSWPQQDVLFVGDACSNLPYLSYSIVYADYVQGQRTLAKVAQRDFAVACFGHGNAITQQAAHRFRRKWAR